MRRQHKAAASDNECYVNRWGSRRAAMLLRQGRMVKGDPHSTGERPAGRIDPPQISAVDSRSGGLDDAQAGVAGIRSDDSSRRYGASTREAGSCGADGGVREGDGGGAGGAGGVRRDASGVLLGAASAVGSRPLVLYSERELDELFDELEAEVAGW